MDENFLKLSQDELHLLFKELDPASVERLCNSSRGLRELCNRYNLWVYSSGQFERITGEALAEIERHNTPEDVVIFCASTPGMTKVCNRGNFWKTILRHHYPNVAGITTMQDARRAYLENARVNFTIRYDPYRSIAVIDSLGHNIPILEVFDDRRAYLGNHDNGENTIVFQIKGSDFKREKIWVRVFGRMGSVTLQAFKTRKEAIDDFVEGWDDFTNVLELGALNDEDLSYDIREFPLAEEDDIMQTYFNAYVVSERTDDTTRIQFSNQHCMDNLARKGYLRFVDGETFEQARQRLRDYIAENGFFCWGMDFARADADPSDVLTIQIFEIELVKNRGPFQEWYDE